MVLVRIVVDGFSLLQSWTGLAPGKARHSAAAREELINRLTQYYDACGTPISVVFDGKTVGGDDLPPSTPELEILYSRPGQRVEQLIERMAHRLQTYGTVLVVANDRAETDPEATAGVRVASTDNFARTVENALEDLERDITTFNQKERSQFNRTL